MKQDFSEFDLQVTRRSLDLGAVAIGIGETVDDLIALDLEIFVNGLVN